MPVIATGANKETSSLIFTPVSLSGSQAANGKAGSAPSMISEKKQNSQFSDIDLAKVTMQDTQQHQQQVHPSPSSSSASSSSGDGTSKEWLGPSECAKSRNSGGNTTERVPVASSEHVAEIVGRQGSKIKALRAKTNTYIKTPVRGEEPVFVVTGRADDVIAAKMEILSVAEHFDHVMALNKARPLPAPPSESDGDGNGSQESSANHVTVRVRVPYRVVGLLVGPKGATIKRIQLDSQTYIVTPSRDKEPIFEITGTPENVERAKAEIEGYIALRTGIADLAPLQHQPTLSPQLQQQQQQQQQLSKFFLPPLNDFSALLASPPSGSSFNALQLLNSLNGSPGDIYATGSHVGNVGQPANPQLMNHATAALLGGHSQPMMKSAGKGAIWSEVKNDPKAWPSAIADVLGTGLPPWFAGTGGAGHGRHLIENGMRKMSLGSCRETPVCTGKSYHDDIFDSPVLNPSNVLGASETSPMLNQAPNLADLCNYDSRFNNAFALVTNNNNNNNSNNSNDSPLNRSNNYLNILLNNPGNAYNNKNLPSLDQKLLATILAIRQNGTSALGQNLHSLQPFGSQLPFNCCDLSLSDLNNNSSCTNGFGCSCTGCSGGQLDYPRNSVVLSSMMMNGPQNHQGDAKSVKSKDDRSSEMNFQSSSSILSGLNLVSPNHVFNDPGGGGKQNASPYLALQCDMGLSYIMAGDRAQDEALRFAGIDSSIMAFSDISSNSNSSSSSSPTDVTERTAY